MNQLSLFDEAAQAPQKPLNVETHIRAKNDAIEPAVERSAPPATSDVAQQFTAEATQFCASMSLTVTQWQILTKACTTEELVIVHELLKVKRHRSGKRAKRATQIRDWLADEQRRLKPLTWYQFQECKPRWPVHVIFPRITHH